MKQTLLPLLFIFSSVLLLGQAETRPGWPPEDEVNPAAIQVFPNPVITHFGLSETKGVETIVLFNLVGHKMRIYEDIAPDKRYYIGDLPRGMYLVQLLGANNKILTTKRVSKR